MTLPPDPEGKNDNRAEWASVALARFQEVTGSEDGDAVSDLICDLHHWCDRSDIVFDFEVELARARTHYEEETRAEVRENLVLKIGETNVTLEYAQYDNGRVAIKLTCTEMPYEPYANATVNLPDDHLEPDEVCMHNWHDDGTVMKALIKAGIISAPVRKIRSGYVMVPVCKLLTYGAH